jgi:hypothetical protein
VRQSTFKQARQAYESYVKAKRNNALTTDPDRLKGAHATSCIRNEERAVAAKLNLLVTDLKSKVIAVFDPDERR